MSVLGCREHNLLRIRCATFEHICDIDPSHATCMFACFVVSEVLLSNPILLVVDFFRSPSESTVHHGIGYWVVQYLEYMMKNTQQLCAQ